jgi:hypothetical protein
MRALYLGGSVEEAEQATAEQAADPSAERAR